MNTTLLIAIGIVIIAVVLLLVYLRRMMQRSREIEKSIDYSKVRQWKDEDE